MRFIDQTKIQVSAGNGGSGAVSWRREKYLPKGGPDGGDGGDGGAVIIKCDPGINTLMDCALNPIVKATSGDAGGSNGKTGRSGTDSFKRVPVGTQIYFKDELVADLDTEGAVWVAARGGRGGKGNAHFKSSTNRSPDRAQPGRKGESFEFALVLKSVADVGLVGLPNAGKSSLVGAITEAHPLVADYPFTTITPSLGVVQTARFSPFVIADIPGIIEHASQGKGMGLQFLQHIERSLGLAYVLDISQDEEIVTQLTTEDDVSDSLLSEKAHAQYELLKNELSTYSEELGNRSSVILFSKSDIDLQQRAFSASKEWLNSIEANSYLISSHSLDGINDLKESLFEKLVKPLR